MNTRLEKIQAMLVDDPHDVFLRYSLAMELAKAGRNDESLENLASLTRESPPYVPAFFMSAQQLAAAERYEEARSFLRDGIDTARAQGDLHAAGEMSQFLASLGTMS